MVQPEIKKKFFFFLNKRRKTEFITLDQGGGGGGLEQIAGGIRGFGAQLVQSENSLMISVGPEMPKAAFEGRASRLCKLSAP